MKDFIFPSQLTCLSCDEELGRGNTKWLCSPCETKVLHIEGHVCSKCGKPVADEWEALEAYGYRCKACQEQFVHYGVHRSFAHYEGPVKQLLMQLKYSGKTYPVPYFAACLKPLLTSGAFSSIDVVMPVPIHFTRKMIRGYNQATLIGKGITPFLEGAQFCDGLKRVKITKKLKNLDKASRKLALKDAIIVNKTYAPFLKGKKVLLVDDIYTTGATLNACAKALYEGGCASIDCVTIAMGY